MSLSNDQLTVWLEDKFAELIGPVVERVESLEQRVEETEKKLEEAEFAFLAAIQSQAVAGVWVEKGQEIWELGLREAFKQQIVQGKKKGNDESAD